MSREYGVGDEVAEGSGDADAALAELDVDFGVEDGGGGVSGEGCKEDERDDGVIKVVVLLERRYKSLRCVSVHKVAGSGSEEGTYANSSVVHASDDKGEKGKAQSSNVTPGLVPSLLD